MLSPRGGRPHDAPPASSSPSPRHTGGMMGLGGEDDHDAGAGAYCGRVLEWERGLPAPSELTPLSHRLISPALAAAFRIGVPAGGAYHHHPPPASSFDGGPPLAHDSPTSHLSFRRDEEEEEEEEDDDGGGDEEGEGETEDPAGPGRSGSGSGKKARMVWTPELHHRFVQAVAHLGDKAAVPKAIVRLMNVDGLTRENVASHLQKYRLYLRRTRATAAPKPRSLKQGYGSHFRPQRPPDSDDLERERDQALQAMGWKRSKDL